MDKATELTYSFTEGIELEDEYDQMDEATLMVEQFYEVISWRT